MKIPKDLNAKIDELAEKRNIQKTELLRELLEEIMAYRYEMEKYGVKKLSDYIKFIGLLAKFAETLKHPGVEIKK